MRPLSLAGLVAVGLCALVLLGSLLMGLDTGEERSEPPDRRLPEDPVRVEVLNAAGIPDLAQRGTDRLRDRGFDVVYYGNAHDFHPDTSLVLDRVGDAGAARAVAEAIGVQRVRTVRDSSLYLEVTVILGSDWGGTEGVEEDTATAAPVQ